MIMKQYTRVYAPIDLDAIRFNMESMKRNLAPGTGILGDRKSTRLNSSHITRYRMPSSA